MILRRLARPMLAAIFISGGINALRNPEALGQVAKPLLDKTVGAQADKLPDAVPTDAETLVRIDGAVKVVAGTALALGKFPRLASLALVGSLIPTTVAGHAFWEKEGADRTQDTIHFLKNAGLVGGLLLAAADTEGKPSLGWRARRAARKAGDQVADTTSSVQDSVRAAQRKATKVVESALP